MLAKIFTKPNLCKNIGPFKLYEFIVFAFAIVAFIIATQVDFLVDVDTFAVSISEVLSQSAFFCICICILLRFKFPKKIFYIIALAFAIQYAFVTGYKIQPFDADDHMLYIMFVGDNFSIPNDTDCFECYHPPVYYVIAASMYNVTKIFMWRPDCIVRYFSVLLSLFSLAMGVQILRFLFNKNESAFLLSTLLWALHPMFFLFVMRVSNEQMFFTLHIFALYCALLYAKNFSPKYLLYGAIATFFAFWTKSSGLVTLAIFSVAFGVSFVCRKSWKMSKYEHIALCVLLLLCVTAALKFLLGKALVGNVYGLDSISLVGAKLYNLLYFDVLDYVKTTWLSGTNDIGGRQFLLNCWLKSSVASFWKILPTNFGELCMRALCLSTLSLFIFSVIGFIKTKLNRVSLILFAQMLLFVAAGVYLRVTVPYASSSDFRYLFPVLLFFCAFCAKGIFYSKPVVKYVGLLICAIFVTASVLMYIGYSFYSVSIFKEW